MVAEHRTLTPQQLLNPSFPEYNRKGLCPHTPWRPISLSYHICSWSTTILGSKFNSYSFLPSTLLPHHGCIQSLYKEQEVIEKILIAPSMLAQAFSSRTQEAEKQPGLNPKQIKKKKDSQFFPCKPSSMAVIDIWEVEEVATYKNLRMGPFMETGPLRRCPGKHGLSKGGAVTQYDCHPWMNRNPDSETY